MPRKTRLKLVHAVAGILLDGNQMLVAERPPDKPYAGYWEFPGGKIEENESDEQALKRELNEELGIHVLSSEYLFSHQHSYPDKKVDLEVWLVNQFTGLPEPRENQILRWANYTEIKALNMFEGNWPILEKLKELLPALRGGLVA